MRRYLLLFVGLVGVVAHATSAQADSMRVTYALGGTASVAILGQISVLSGNMTVKYTATGGIPGGTAGNVLHGPARIFGTGNVGGPLSIMGFGLSIVGNLTGPIGFGGPGSLTSGAGNLALPFNALLGGTLHCSPATTCTSLAGIPASITAPVSLPLAGILNALSVGAISGTILGSFNFQQATVATFAGLPVFLNLTASEVSRVYVPEPSTLPLLGMGLVVVGLAGRSLRRRR